MRFLAYFCFNEAEARTPRMVGLPSDAMAYHLLLQ